MVAKTVYPRRAKVSAADRPKPVLAPVIKTTVFMDSSHPAQNSKKQTLLAADLRVAGMTSGIGANKFFMR
jgi:hypothetical protein